MSWINPKDTDVSKESSKSKDHSSEGNTNNEVIIEKFTQFATVIITAVFRKSRSLI